MRYYFYFDPILYNARQSPAHWTRVNLNSNRTDPCAGLCAVRQVPARPYQYADLVSTLMARPDFLQYPAYHRPILPYLTRLVQCDIK